MEKAKQMAPSNVAFTGQLSHDSALQLCKESSIFIFPSDWYEGFPLSLLEAMATGRAIVASDLGPRSETIVDGETGLLFEAGNSEDLRRKVLQLIENPGLYQHLGTSARRAFLEAYTPGKNYTMLMDIYRSVSKSI
jgi:glycosyltransferase involved in cell wall biosynthesis